MANITLGQLIIEVQRHLLQRRADHAIPARVDDLAILIPRAEQQLCAEAEGDAGLRGLLTKTYAATPFTAAGELDLAAAPFADLYIPALKYANVYTTALAEPIDFWPSRRAMLGGTLHSEFGRYCIDGSRLISRAPTGVTFDATVDVTITDAIFKPVVAVLAASTTLPPLAEKRLIEIVAQMQMERAGAAQQNA